MGGASKESRPRSKSRGAESNAWEERRVACKPTRKNQSHMCRHLSPQRWRGPCRMQHRHYTGNNKAGEEKHANAGDPSRSIDCIDQRHWEAAARRLYASALHIGRAHGGLQRQRPASRLQHCCNPSPSPRRGKRRHSNAGDACQRTKQCRQSPHGCYKPTAEQLRASHASGCTAA